MMRRTPELREHACRRAVRFFAVPGILAAVMGLWAQTSNPTEYQVKAAYLSNFGRFIEWPAKSSTPEDQPFLVCVLGDDPFGPALDGALAGEAIRKAPMSARRITAVKDAGSCRILYIASSEEHHLKAVLGALEGSPLLTVSDIPDFVRRGGMIQFVVSGKRVRFEINLASTDRAGLSVSSDLLKLALSVRRTP